jgi:hypothetical protein
VLTELAAIRASIMGRGTRRRQHWRGGVQNRFAATVPRLRACPGGLLADERPRRRGLAAGRRAPGVGPRRLPAVASRPRRRLRPRCVGAAQDRARPRRHLHRYAISRIGHIGRIGR